MLSTKLITAIIIGASVFIAACGDSTSNSADPVDSAKTKVALKFAGTYSTSCVLNSPADHQFGVAATYSINLITLGGTSGTTRAYFYTDASCTQPDISAETMIEYSVVYPGGTHETPLGIADFINVTIESVSVDGQPLSEEELESFDAAGGFDTGYNIYMVNEDLLYLNGESGEEFDGTTEERRTNTLNNVPLMRQ